MSASTGPTCSLAVCPCPASGVRSGRWARALCSGKAPHTHTRCRVSQGPALASPRSARIRQRSTWVGQGEPMSAMSASAGARGGWVGAEVSRRLGAADEPWVRVGPACRWAGQLRDPPAPLGSHPKVSGIPGPPPWALTSRHWGEAQRPVWAPSTGLVGGTPSGGEARGPWGTGT